MKHFLCFVSVILLASCDGAGFSKGVKKDLRTGQVSSFNGLSVEDIFLADDKGARLNSNEVLLGNALLVVASGVDGFQESDGKVFPGCKIVLTDKNNTELLNLPDAFAHLSEGMPADQATELKATLTTGEPMVAGEKYQLSVHFFDKRKVESVITSSVSLLAR